MDMVFRPKVLCIYDFMDSMPRDFGIQDIERGRFACIQIWTVVDIQTHDFAEMAEIWGCTRRNSSLCWQLTSRYLCVSQFIIAELRAVLSQAVASGQVIAGRGPKVRDGLAEFSDT